MKPPDYVWMPVSDSPGERTEYMRIGGGLLWRTVIWSANGMFRAAPSVGLTFQPERQ